MRGSLTTDQIENIFKSQAICRIGFSDGLQPYVIPMTYYYDGKAIYCQTYPGKKMDLIKKNPRVCVQVDIIGSMNNFQSAMANGVIEILHEEDANAARALLYENIMTLMTNTRVHHFGGENANEAEIINIEKPVMIKIVLKDVAGIFEKQ